mgnify:CR=1 FL=1
MAVGRRWSVVGSSVVGRWSSVVGRWSSSISPWSSLISRGVVGDQSLGRRRSVVGRRIVGGSSAVRRPSSVVLFPQSVVGCWVVVDWGLGLLFVLCGVVVHLQVCTLCPHAPCTLSTSPLLTLSNHHCTPYLYAPCTASTELGFAELDACAVHVLDVYATVADDRTICARS